LGALNRFIFVSGIFWSMVEVRISPTRIALYGECARKWQYAELFKLTSDSRATRFGTEVHAAVEKELRGTPGAVDAPVARAAATLLDLAFEVGAPVAIEQEMAVGPVQCRIDLLVRTPDGELVLVDHKTSSDPSRWAPTPSELAARPQAALYALAVMRAYDLASLRCSWHYVSSKGRGAPVVRSFVIQRAAAERVLEEALPAIGAMLAAAETPDRLLTAAWELDPFTTVCSAYGGCPYAERCMQEGRSDMKGFTKTKSLEILQAATPVAEAPAAPELINPPPLATAKPAKRIKGRLISFDPTTGVVEFEFD